MNFADDTTVVGLTQPSCDLQIPGYTHLLGSHIDGETNLSDEEGAAATTKEFHCNFLILLYLCNDNRGILL